MPALASPSGNCSTRLALLAAVATALPTVSAGGVDFNREVRPILSDLCWNCHGFDSSSREGGLRLDGFGDALLAGDSGLPAVVPGDPGASEMIRRLLSEESGETMPPPRTGKKATPAQIATLKAWIAEGAAYDTHWSFKPIKRIETPEVDDASWPRSDLDRFVLAELESRGLHPAPEADPNTLLRRVSFDLTGLPPTPEELDAFLEDGAPDAYERAVDRLLASPHFGERLALDWLDAARYADTNGYFGDKPREIWPWRDWVIRAFNEGMPYDRFVVEQLAGDLLPGATAEQRIATGFQRNHMVTNESGIIDEEYRVEYVADRLETTGSVWLGLTLNCARCHDHKYDPISQREYFQLFAYFNSAVETGLVRAASPPPVMEVPDPEAERHWSLLQERSEEAAAAFAVAQKPHRQTYAAWESELANRAPHPPESGLAARVGFDPHDAGVRAVGSVVEAEGMVGGAARFDGMQHLELPADTALEADRPWTLGWWMQADGTLSGVLGKIEPEGRRRGFEVYWRKGRLHIGLIEEWGVKAVELVLGEPLAARRWHHVVLRYDGSGRAEGLVVFIDGRVADTEVRRDSLEGSIANGEPLRIGRRDEGLGYYGLLDEMRLYDCGLDEGEIHEWWWGEQARAVLAQPADEREARHRDLLVEAYARERGEAGLLRGSEALRAARDEEERFRASLPRTLVVEELDTPRPTHLLVGGQYDQPGEEVGHGVPAVLPPLPENAPPDRLGLARWLVHPEQPLTPRVVVNRFWQQCFGEGLVRSVEDFGSQGEPPTHPALLDWLAASFVESGWDVKELLRRIVTSAAYRQSSVPGRDLLDDDPENRLLARGPRFRLQGEMIRDQALAASGLLSPRLGGPSVMPYQPEGLWEDVTYDGEDRYQADRDDGLWRRSLYTFWKRQLPPPALQTFDSPTRETCTLQRPRTNTPLQALVLLNDTTYVEAGRALATLVLARPGDAETRLREAFVRVTARMPSEEEQAVLLALLERQQARFRSHPAAANALLSVGEASAGRGDGLDPSELAAWTLTLHTLFNLDEAITRR